MEKMIISTLNEKRLNSKTNNYIFTELTKEEIEKIRHDINPICILENPSIEVKEEINRIDIPNMIVDISSVNIEELLNETLLFLKINEMLPFLDKMSLLRFKGYLRKYNQAVQWIFFNGENLSEEKQMKINEIFWFNTYFFNINYLLTTSNLTTYRLVDGSYLDYRENYQKFHKFRYYE